MPERLKVLEGGLDRVYEGSGKGVPHPSRDR